MRKIITVLQPQIGQPSDSNTTTATVSLIPRFNPVDEGKSPITHVNTVNLCSNTWILDSGATNHVVCSLDFLVDYRLANGAEVHLPNGQCITVTHIGNVELSNGLWLKEVLHIPSFQFNLISVSKLIQDTSCELVFMSEGS